jgi:hypothetical protein
MRELAGFDADIVEQLEVALGEFRSVEEVLAGNGVNGSLD